MEKACAKKKLKQNRSKTNNLKAKKGKIFLRY